MTPDQLDNIIALLILVATLILGSIGVAVIFVVQEYLALRWREWRSGRHRHAP